MAKFRPLTGNDLINDPNLFNKIGAHLGLRAKKNFQDRAKLLGDQPIKGTEFEQFFNPSELDIPVTRDMTRDEMINAIKNSNPYKDGTEDFRNKLLFNNGKKLSSEELKKTIQALGIDTDIPLNVSTPQPHEMTPEELADRKRLLQEMVEEDKRKKERIENEKKEKKEKTKRYAEHEFSRNPPKTELERERDEYYLLSKADRNEELERLKKEAYNRKLEREAAIRNRRALDLEASDEQIARMEEQNKSPREKIDLAIKALQDADIAQNHAMPTWLQQLQKLKGEMALREFNKPYEEYRGQQIPDETINQLTAQQKLMEMDPFEGETKKRLNDIEEKIRNVAQSPAQKAAAEFLGNPRQTLGEAHRDLVGDEEAEMERIYRQRAMEHLEEDILPKIRDKYAVPGVRSHGHESRDKDRAIRNYSRELNNSLNELRLKNKQLTIPATLQYEDTKAKKAQIAATSGTSDAQHEMASIAALQNAQDRRYKQEDQYIDVLNRMGEKEQTKEAQRLALEKERFNEKRDFNREKLAELSNLIQGHPISSVTTQTKAMAPAQMTSPYSTIGQGVMGMAANAMPRFKKGGRIKKAIGGTLNPMDPIQDAINWSIIDKESPLHELKRDVRRQRALGLMNTLKQRRMYAIGGGVSPIEEGAAIADEVSLKEKMKRAKIKAFEQAERDQIETELPLLTRGLEAFSRGISRSTPAEGMRKNWLERAAPAMAGAFEDRANAEKELRAQKQSAIDRQLKMLEGEEASERDFRDYALRKQQIESQMQHQRAMEGLASQRLSEKTQAPLKLDKIDSEILRTSNQQMMSAPKLIDQLEYMETLADRINTGGITSDLPIIGSARAQSMFGETKQADYEAFDKTANDFVVEATKTFGQRGGARIAKLISEAKPNRSMSNKGLKEIISKMKEALNEEIERSYYLNEALEQGIKPTTALTEWQKKQDLSKEPSNSNQKMPLTPEEIMRRDELRAKAGRG